MMRQIKFRAWDKKLEFMEDVEIINFGVDVTTMNDSGASTHKWEDVELMQFTGLHDKNGKEIWEGDIVEWFQQLVEDGYQTGTLIREAVKFDAEGLYRVHCLQSNNNIKVLGNIYENPEFLERAKGDK